MPSHPSPNTSKASYPGRGRASQCSHTLLLAADQLQRAVERHEYAEAAHLVEAVQQLSMHFQSFAQIPKVAELAGRVATLQRSLHMNVMREFELLGTGEESTNPLLLERLKACCLVTDALGYKVGIALPPIPGCRAAYSRQA